MNADPIRRSVEEAQKKAAAAPVDPNHVWLICYRPCVDSIDAKTKRAMVEIIGVARSKEESDAMVIATQAYEAAEGLGHIPILVSKVPLGVNLVVEGEEGPIQIY
jgi:hypothetical protein